MIGVPDILLVGYVGDVLVRLGGIFSNDVVGGSIWGGSPLSGLDGRDEVSSARCSRASATHKAQILDERDSTHLHSFQVVETFDVCYPTQVESSTREVLPWTRDVRVLYWFLDIPNMIVWRQDRSMYG